MPRNRMLVALVVGALTTLGASGDAQAQKYGGVLQATIRSNPPDLSIHESAVVDTTESMQPVYNNVVVFDVFQKLETLETVVPDLAESWNWSADGKELRFKLRSGVTWHDGKPFTSEDVKHTFDVVRGVSKARLKLNPRKLWYANVKEIVTRGDHEVVFKVGRYQPSLVVLLACGCSPVYPAHVSPAALRTTAVGTGPFKLKEYVREQRVALEKNRAYFVKGRPYLDGVVLNIIRNPTSQNAALVSGQVDVGTINDTPKPLYDQLKAADPTVQFVPTPSNATLNIIVNTKKPPLNDLRLRQAVNLAMDRNALIRSIYQNGAVPGGAMIPAPYGYWGLTPEQLKTMPGYGDPEANKSEARKLLAEAGYGPNRPLKIVISTRTNLAYTGPAAWMISQLADVGVQAEMKSIDTGTWYGMVARRDFQLGMNATAIGVDDPDAVLYENYACNSQRNYSDYCNPELEKQFDAQSVETDKAKRQQLVREIDMTLQREVARPYLAYRTFYYAHRAYVKNWLPHTSIFNGWRMQEVWLDK
ncbi:MAG: ABC transporter substrate-binding protein [Candidatus Lambdaproteobacteria bacterium]|nr:ABC transporter substrate-binding protein [Candidatus Lambdaproteobacteria bacterium]